MKINWCFTVILMIEFFFIGFLWARPTKEQSDKIEQVDRVIQECQKDLPRSQMCELTAKVKESGK